MPSVAPNSLHAPHLAPGTHRGTERRAPTNPAMRRAWSSSGPCVSRSSQAAKEDAFCLSSEALHPWHSSGGFGYPSDSFGSSAPILNAASRSLAKLLACCKSGRLHQVKLADKQHAKPSRLPSAALHPWHSSSGSKHRIDSFGRCAPILAAASRFPRSSWLAPSPAACIR